MNFATALPLALMLFMSAVHAQQSAEEIARARAIKARELRESNAGVHAQYEADAPKREAQRRWRETHRPWRLLVFHAFRPGVLSLCKDVHRGPDFERLAMPDAADPRKARWLVEAASIQWPGGRFSQAAAGDAPAEPRLLTNACFMLFVDGRPVMSGAVVSSYSARRFDFPAVIVDGGPAAEPLTLRLAARFPAPAGEPVPAGWGELLKGLAGADQDRRSPVAMSPSQAASTRSSTSSNPAAPP